MEIRKESSVANFEELSQGVFFVNGFELERLILEFFCCERDNFKIHAERDRIYTYRFYEYKAPSDTQMTVLDECLVRGYCSLFALDFLMQEMVYCRTLKTGTYKIFFPPRSKSVCNFHKIEV
jgi:hypothetical protein